MVHRLRRFVLVWPSGLLLTDIDYVLPAGENAPCTKPKDRQDQQNSVLRLDLEPERRDLRVSRSDVWLGDLRCCRYRLRILASADQRDSGSVAEVISCVDFVCFCSVPS